MKEKKKYRLKQYSAKGKYRISDEDALSGGCAVVEESSFSKQAVDVAELESYHLWIKQKKSIASYEHIARQAFTLQKKIMK
jgi:hypothetical protein